MRVDGDSMKDAGILDGDLLIVDRSAKPGNGCAVVAVNGEYTVKRLRRGPDCVWLESANSRYQPIRVSVGKDFHVFGVVKRLPHSQGLDGGVGITKQEQEPGKRGSNLRKGL